MNDEINFERPQSEEALAAILRTAYELALKEQGVRALALCDWLIEEQTTTIAGYRQRAAVREYLGDIEGAISDLELIIAQESKEPADFHAVGILYFKVGQMSKAEAAFSDALEQGCKARNAYYRNSSHLFRAELRLMRMDRAGAHDDVAQLPDEYSTYIPGAGMRSKEQILARVAAI